MPGILLWYIETPIGVIRLAQDDEGICALHFVDSIDASKEDSIGASNVEETPLLHMAAEQLKDYFRGERTAFALPLSYHGTPFQNMVWRALLTIPYGETRSYKEIAQAIGNPNAARAVGMANNRNPISIIVPCHRVIGSNQSLVGYGGGLDRKAFLLELEQQNQD